MKAAKAIELVKQITVISLDQILRKLRVPD